MLDKKQIRAHFLFEFKMGCKAAETTHSINSAFGPETANEHSGAKCGRVGRGGSLEKEECSGRPTNWERSSKLSLLQQTLPKHSGPNILRSFSIWSKLERWKSSESVSWADHKSKKTVVLKCHLLLLYATAMKTLPWRVAVAKACWL